MDFVSPQLSVIIPLGSALGPQQRLLQSLQTLPAATEIIFVSSGEYFPRLQKQQAQSELSGYALKWLCAAAGSGPQLNTAAAAARGNWLWFLRPHQAFSAGLVQELDRLQQQTPENLIVCRLRLLSGAPLWLRLLNRFCRDRDGWWLRPAAEQGLCLYKPLFSSLGGFPQAGAQTEAQLIWHAQQQGLPLLMTDQTLESSALNVSISHFWQSLQSFWQLQIQQRLNKTRQQHQ